MKNNVMDFIPEDGFYKIQIDRRDDLTPQERIKLIRRGNELFNQGNYELAHRLFLTLHYSDGIIRLGDHYYKEGNALKALEMYKLAPDQGRIDQMIRQMLPIIHQWINE
ncbi:MAG: hypothetical protein PF447_01515 [Spirochaetaceae bacterium]|nr:hypothetical protein [Spirochaetaceae bacterium]